MFIQEMFREMNCQTQNVRHAKQPWLSRQGYRIASNKLQEENAINADKQLKEYGTESLNQCLPSEKLLENNSMLTR